MKNSHKFFKNTECRYFPCHENIPSAHFNCLFCYCPLYPLGEHCGGSFEYVGELHDVKCCSNCDFPHNPDNYGLVVAKLHEIIHSNKSVTFVSDTIAPPHWQTAVALRGGEVGGEP